jgi:D-alanyl-D-alanine carboxypeptidase/D-alanyl-D-alanine-endopeptidase (penicillin-binding protein 4)
MAEQIALAAGATLFGPPADWDKAQRTIERFLVEQVGLQPGQFAIRNASGLHDVNRVSPRQMVAVLRTMYRDPRLRPEFVASLSVAGSSGTLSSRMRDTDALGLLRAKTGTLSISSALSGYVTAKQGETLGFSIIINDYKTPISELWAAQDEVGVVLAAHDTHCRTAPLAAGPTRATEVAAP